MNIVYGLPRTGSHLVARHIANNTGKLFLGEVFKAPTTTNVSINEKRIFTLPKNCVIIVHPHLGYGYYSDNFYNWLFEHKLDVTFTDDMWRQVLSFGMASATGYYHTFGSNSTIRKCNYKKNVFDQFKNSFIKYRETYNRIQINKSWSLQDAHLIHRSKNDKYKLTKKTYNLTTDQLFSYYTNQDEILKWYDELLLLVN